MFSGAAIQTCLTMKVLFGMALRQIEPWKRHWSEGPWRGGFVESLLRLTGLDWIVPDFSTICRRQRTLAVNSPYRGTKDPLHLLPRSRGLKANRCRATDSTGIKVEGEGEWNARKHGGLKRRVWRKIPIGIEEQTLEIRAVEITGSNTGDAPMLPHLLNQIPRDQHIGSVTADGASDTRRCHTAIHCPVTCTRGADRAAAAIIPPRRSAQPWKPTTAGAIARNDALRGSKYLGRALWRNGSGYHRRSRVETKMHCMKLRGQRLPLMVCKQTIAGRRMAHDFARQVAEVQVRIAILNGYTVLGISGTKARG